MRTKETARKETARQETARQERARQERARQETAQQEPVQPRFNCLCMGMGPKLTEMLTCHSEGAATHLRNARIEFLKAIRALLDERIEQLARDQKKKGTTVNVE